MVAWCILALGTALGDDRSPDPDRLFTLLNMPIEVVPPRVVACHPRCFGTLEFDQQRISMRILVEATLDIEPLLERFALLCIVDVVDELVDPQFNRAVHLIVSGVVLLEGNRRLTGFSHDFHTTSSASSERAAPLGARKNTAVRLVGSRRSVRQLALRAGSDVGV